MSILLTALKNAALEKQKRDNNLLNSDINNDQIIDSFLNAQESITNKKPIRDTHKFDAIKEKFLLKMADEKRKLLQQKNIDEDFLEPIRKPVKPTTLTKPAPQLSLAQELELNIEQDKEKIEQRATQTKSNSQITSIKPNLELSQSQKAPEPEPEPENSDLELNEEFMQLTENDNPSSADLKLDATSDESLELDLEALDKSITSLTDSKNSNNAEVIEKLLDEQSNLEELQLDLEIKPESIDPGDENAISDEVINEAISVLTHKEPAMVPQQENDNQQAPASNQNPSEAFTDALNKEVIERRDKQKKAFIKIKNDNIKRANNYKIQYLSAYAIGIIILVAFAGFKYFSNTKIELVAPKLTVQDSVLETTESLLNTAPILKNGDEIIPIVGDFSVPTDIKELDLPKPVTSKVDAPVISKAPPVVAKKPAKAVVQKSNAQPLSIKVPPTSAYQDAINAAFASYQQGDFINSKSHYLTALSIEPTSSDAQFGLANIAMAEQNFSKAIEYYQMRINLQPNDSLALSGMILAANQFENVNKLKEQLNQILIQNPKASHLYFIQGTLFSRQQNWVDAQNSFFTAWQYSPDKAVYAFNLAVSLEQLDQPKAALTFYKKAFELNDQSKRFIDSNVLSNRIEQLVKYYD